MTEKRNFSPIFPEELQRAFRLAGVVSNTDPNREKINILIGKNIGIELKNGDMTISDVDIFFKEYPLLNRETIWREISKALLPETAHSLDPKIARIVNETNLKLH